MKSILKRSLFMFYVVLFANCGPGSDDNKICPQLVKSTHSRLVATFTAFEIGGEAYSNEKKMSTRKSLREDCKIMIAIDDSNHGCKLTENEKLDLKEIKTSCQSIMIDDCPHQLVISFGNFAKDYSNYLIGATKLNEQENLDKRKALFKACEDILTEHATVEKCLMTDSLYTKKEVRESICEKLRK